MQARTRTYIRRAAKEGLTVRLTPESDDLERYYQLHRSTYERTGARAHPIEYFRAIWATFVATGLSRVIFAEVDGRPVAAINVALYKGLASYWTGASSEAGRARHANDVLQWEAMELARELGCSSFESGEASVTTGASAKQKAISDFKRKFGGTLVPFARGKRMLRGPLTNRLISLAERRHRRD